MARISGTTRLRRVFAVLLAVALMGALGASAFAYDSVTGSDLPNGTPTSTDNVMYGDGSDLERSDKWWVFRVWHWVTRGDDLNGIAAKYDTTVGYILSDPLNANYFADLTLRNATTGLNTKLEPGVRLHIYDVVRVRHFVRRGDDWARLTSGLKNGNFTLLTDEQAIKNENPEYFANLALLNKTQGTSWTLIESDQVFGDQSDFSGTLVDNGTTILMGSATPGLVGPAAAGLPLYITVPVFTSPALPVPDAIYEYGELSYLQPGGLERGIDRYAPGLPDLREDQWATTNPLASNDLIPGVADGWTRTIGVPLEVHWTLTSPAYVPGWYHAKPLGGSGGAAGGSASTSSRYTQNGGRPSDPQPAGATAYWNGQVGNGAQILQNIAKNHGTTVAAIRAKNPGYFEYLDKHHVSLEAGVWIWI